MEITGRIIAVLPPQGGVSQRTGQQWSSQQFVLQTDERFPQKFLFKVFGQDKLSQWNIQMGQLITVQFSVDAHESNGRWYGENTAYNVISGQQMQQQPASQPQYQPAAQQPQYQQQVQSPFPPQGGQPQYQQGQQQYQQGQQQGGNLPFPPVQ